MRLGAGASLVLLGEKTCFALWSSLVGSGGSLSFVDFLFIERNTQSVQKGAVLGNPWTCSRKASQNYELSALKARRTSIAPNSHNSPR